MQNVKYVCGIFMVGLGIMMLIFCAVGAVSAFADNQMIVGLIVGGVFLLFGSTLLIVGMWLVRSVENEDDRKKKEARPQQYHSENYSKEQIDHDLDQSENYGEQRFNNDLRTKFANFNLSRLNLWGWFLFLSTIGFMLVVIAIMVVFLEIDFEKGGAKLFGIAAFFLCLVYFAVTKMILSAFGIKISHEKQDSNR